MSAVTKEQIEEARQNMMAAREAYFNLVKLDREQRAVERQAEHAERQAQREARLAARQQPSAPVTPAEPENN